jgi:cysteine synthase
VAAVDRYSARTRAWVHEAIRRDANRSADTHLHVFPLPRRGRAQESYPVPEWIVVGAGTGGTSATIGRYLRYRRARQPGWPWWTRRTRRS